MKLGSNTTCLAPAWSAPALTWSALARPTPLQHQSANGQHQHAKHPPTNQHAQRHPYFKPPATPTSHRAICDHFAWSPHDHNEQHRHRWSTPARRTLACPTSQPTPQPAKHHHGQHQHCQHTSTPNASKHNTNSQPNSIMANTSMPSTT